MLTLVLKVVFAIVVLAVGMTDLWAEGRTPRILFMGDSLFAVHSVSGRSVADATEDFLGEPIRDNSVLGARILYNLPLTGAMGLKIAKQYRKGDWDWIVLNGGGNDLWLGCGCNRCERRMDRMISADANRGKIPSLVARLRGTGARLVYVGYLRSPDMNSPIEGCKDEGDELERRLAIMAERDPGLDFLSLAELVPPGDRSYFGVDMIHPSVKTSRLIGRMIADLIRAKGAAEGAAGTVAAGGS